MKDVPKLICDGVLPELTPEVIADESYKPLTDILILLLCFIFLYYFLSILFYLSTSFV